MAKRRKFFKRKFHGFGVTADTARMGMRVLNTAAMDAEDGHCGPALERLGKAKVLLGSQVKRSEATRLILDVKRMCPKERLTVYGPRRVREELRRTPREDMPEGIASDWERFREKWAHGRLMKPRRRPSRPGDEAYDVHGERWVYPTKVEELAYKQMKQMQKLAKVAERAAKGRKEKRASKGIIEFTYQRRGPIGARGPIKRRRLLKKSERGGKPDRRGGARKGAGRKKKG